MYIQTAKIHWEISTACINFLFEFFVLTRFLLLLYALFSRRRRRSLGGLRDRRRRPDALSGALPVGATPLAQGQ